MCLHSLKHYKTKKEALQASKKPLIAEKDITVYKRLNLNDNSPYQFFKYEKGYEYIEHSFLKDETKVFYIWQVKEYYFIKNKGFHAYRSKNKAEAFRNTYTQKIVKMVIPKGAKYFLGVDSEIVSNRIIYY